MSLKTKKPVWHNKNLKNELISFLKLYKKRPIKNNFYGMRINHMFAVYFILKKLKPKFVIESGIYGGQSTWLIEKTLPKTKILSIDLNLSNRKYISKKTIYSQIDFKYHNYEKIPKDTLVFFDDHQCHLERLKQCKFFNIKHIICEDNYKINKGDFYTLKHILKGSGFIHKPGTLSLIKTFFIFIKFLLKKIINQNYFLNMDLINSRLRDRAINKNDKNSLKSNIEIYYEFPKIISLTKDKKIKNYIVNNYKQELSSYNFLTYIKLY